MDLNIRKLSAAEAAEKQRVEAQQLRDENDFELPPKAEPARSDVPDVICEGCQ